MELHSAHEPKGNNAGGRLTEGEGMHDGSSSDSCGRDDSDLESLSDLPFENPMVAMHDGKVQNSILILEKDISLAIQETRFLEKVFVWLCMIVVLPALIEVAKDAIVRTTVCKDPPACATVPRVVQLFPLHIVSAVVFVILWNVLQGASDAREGHSRKQRQATLAYYESQQEPLWHLSGIPPSLQSDQAVYQDLHVLLSSTPEAIQPLLHAQEEVAHRSRRSEFPALWRTTIAAVVLICCSWAPFYGMSTTFRLRFEKCARDKKLQEASVAAFQSLMECEVEKAVGHGMAFTDEFMTPALLARKEASQWSPRFLNQFMYVPFFLQACNLWQLTPIEVLGGVMAGGYVVVAVLVQIETNKVRTRAALAKPQIHDEIRRSSPVSVERPLQNVGEEVIEIQAMLKACKAVMKATLYEPKRILMHQWLIAALLCACHLASTTLVRETPIGGRETQLTPRMEAFAFWNQILFVGCTIHFYLKSVRVVPRYERSVPRLQAWRAMWHRRTCSLFQDYVEGLSHETPRGIIRDNFVFMRLDTLAKMDAWRRLQAYVRLQVLQDRIEAEGLCFLGLTWMLMWCSVRLAFMVINGGLNVAPTLWLFLAIDTIVFGRPILKMMSTCIQMTVEHKLDLQYLTERREEVLRCDTTQGSTVLSHLLESFIRKDEVTQEYETLLDINITPGLRTSAIVVLASSAADAVWKLGLKTLFESGD